MWTNYPRVSEDRLELMYEGVLDLEIWISDLLRKGPNFLVTDNLITRLTDFKLSGIASFVRLYIDSKADIARPISLLFYFVSKYKYFFENNIYPDADTLQFAGITLKKDDILKNEPEILDDWSILLIEEGEEVNLCYRIVWLGGTNTGKIAKILDFRRPNENFFFNYSSQFVYKGSLVFYPSEFPIRALPKYLIESPKGNYEIKITEDMHQPFIQNPYLIELPVYLHNHGVLNQNENFFLVDSIKRMFKIQEKVTEPKVFGFWNGYELKIIQSPSTISNRNG